ncbi:hypothetical protein B5P43_15815 [Bacillus sp. SRB_336]|nr:hypothetical protein B5P43_15815 [Bacillus sp. SRB_336]
MPGRVPGAGRRDVCNYQGRGRARLDQLAPRLRARPRAQQRLPVGAPTVDSRRCRAPIHAQGHPRHDPKIRSTSRERSGVEMSATIAEAPENTRHTVDLPGGYDDARDRERLPLQLAKSLGEGSWQVERIVTGEDGAQQAVVVDGQPVFRPGGRMAILNDGVRESSIGALDAVLQKQGLSLVDFRGDTAEAVVAAVAPATRQLRDRLAPHLGAKYPHQVELAGEWGPTPSGDAGYLTAVHVRKTPTQIDKAKRRQGLLQAIANTVPAVPDTLWRYREDVRTGLQTARRTVDPLREMITAAEFTERFPNPEKNPTESWRRFPVAVREDGRCVMFDFFHSLIVGQTGAGKGSVIWSILGGLIPAARLGLVKMYAIDPKGAEAIGDDGKPLGMFADVATDPDSWSIMLTSLVDDMNRRKGKGRKQAVTKENPLVVLLIDEMSALTKLDTDPKRKAQTASDLLTILSQGRSMNFLVVGAVQAPQKEMVGPQRDFMPMRIALRTGTASETDLVLGEGALERGADAHLIPVAGPGNAYRSAGTGYMQLDGDPDPVRIRFPYTDDAQLAAWSEEFYTLKRSGRFAVAAPVVDLDEMEIMLGDLDLGEMEIMPDDIDGFGEPGSAPPIPAFDPDTFDLSPADIPTNPAATPTLTDPAPEPDPDPFAEPINNADPKRPALVIEDDGDFAEEPVTAKPKLVPAGPKPLVEDDPFGEWDND